MIHVIGDSHICSFNGYDTFGCERLPDPNDKMKHFRTYNLSPMQAYQLGLTGCPTTKTFFDILNKIPIEETILIVLGEIDCRTLILRKVLSEYYTYEEAVEIHIDLMLKGLKRIKHPFVIWAPTPILYKQQSKIFCYGELNECHEATIIFNRMMKERIDFPQINISDIMFRENLIKPENYLGSDFCHLKGEFARNLAKDQFIDLLNIDPTERK
jgi:hypothetical protein